MMEAVFKGKRVLIAGLGKSGVAAFDALLRTGAFLAVCDDRDIGTEDPGLFARLNATGVNRYLGGVPVPDLTWDYVILSPGVPPDLPYIERARAHGTDVFGELELSWRLGRGMYAAITGTNGKTTTTTLIGEIFKDAGLKTVVAGNIGTAVVGESIKADDDTWLVTEASSFQLETTERFRPSIAAVLNLTPDHMDRHKTMENYAAAKAKIFANQGKGDALVYNADDERVSAMAAAAGSKKIPFSRRKALGAGAYAQGGQIVFADGSGETRAVLAADELLIPGAHNLENALAAVAVACAAGISTDAIAKTLKRFKGVEHRLELVIETGGVRFVNDSKGTNPDASIKAIEAVGKDIIIIAGGYDKAACFAGFVRAAKGKVKKFLLVGATAESIKAAAVAEGYGPDDVIIAGTMDEAVRLGSGLAAPGDTVLLSPACASWDMYSDYEERGAHFKRLAFESGGAG